MNVHTFGVSPKSIDGSSSLHTTSQRRTHNVQGVYAGRKKKSSRKDPDFQAPCRPPSMFIKQSPIPARRPLRCVPPLMVLSEAPEDVEPVVTKRSTKLDAEELPRRKSRTEVDRVSKWASLFEAAKTTSGGENGASTPPTKDADAWFDKIFPKNANPQKDAKLSKQQEKSIQQLQSLVKTLGVATQGPTLTSRGRSKPSKMRQMSGQGGAGVDPVPFSSILKKLQSVSQLENMDVSAKKLPELQQQQLVEEEVEDEIENADHEEDDGDTAQSEDGDGNTTEDDDAGGLFSDPASVERANELSKLTIPVLKSMAKSKGLSGYSKLKKDDLVQLLVKDR